MKYVLTLSSVGFPLSIYAYMTLLVTNGLPYTFFTVKDNHREKSTLLLNGSTYEKCEYGYLGRLYIKLTLFKRF